VLPLPIFVLFFIVCVIRLVMVEKDEDGPVR
jgi:hypothetical protein